MLRILSLSQRTQYAFLSIRLMGTPFWCLLSMLAFVLYKQGVLSSVQLTLLIALKPTSSLLSPYWSQAIYQRPDRLIPNLIGANIFRYLPFVFLPWCSSSWWIISAFGIYMTLSRAAVPAWIELFKYNLPKEKQEQVVGYATTVDYVGTALLAMGMGLLLDLYQENWRWIFSAAAMLGLLSTTLLTSTRLCFKPSASPIPPLAEKNPRPSFTEAIRRPWKQVWELIKHHKSFTIYQIGFMLGGAGLMIMQPALPQFFVDNLHLSFTAMGAAISFCKGIGVALTSTAWTRLYRSLTIYQLSALVTLFASLFPCILISTSLHISLLYIAYILYGVMQAGSELSWHMSSLAFAQEKDTSTFSITNVLTVGIRGCCVPALGSLLLPILRPGGVLCLGGLICLSASLFFLLKSRYAPPSRLSSPSKG